MVSFIKALKLAKYGLNFKMNLICGIVFFAVGMFVEIGTRGISYLGGFYIVLSVMFIYQMIVSISVSTMAQTSAYKRQLRVSLPVLASFILSIVSYGVLVIVQYIMTKTSADASLQQQQIIALYLTGALLFAMELYMGLCYKYFILGVALMMISVTIVTSLQDLWKKLIAACELPFFKSISGAAITGVVFLILGAVCEYVFNCLLYKKELSKYVFAASLRKAAK